MKVVEKAKPIRYIAGICLSFLIFFLIGRSIYFDWQRVIDFQWSMNITLLVISVISLAIALLSHGIMVRYNLRLFVPSASFLNSIYAYLVSQLAKYLPGGIFTLIGRIYIYRHQGITKEIASVSLLLEVCTMLVGSLAAFLISLPLWQKNDLLARISLILVLLPIILLFVHPGVLKKIIKSKFFSKKVKNNFLDGLEYFDVFKLVLLYVLHWFVMRLAFTFFVASVSKIELSWILPLCGALAISWATGFVSFLTPAGLGVREGILALLLSVYLPSSVALLIALLSRLWWTTTELACIGGVWTVDKLIKNRR